MSPSAGVRSDNLLVLQSRPEDPAAELVAVLDDSGEPHGFAIRAEVRRSNLLHAATAILVRRPDGRVYVHRRTDSKDIYPGAHDCWAGGVVVAGELPDEGARRELSEELGIEGAPLEPLLVTRWTDVSVRAIYHVYAVRWDGPIVHQESEVAWGAWWTLEQLRTRLADPSFDFAPDGRRLLEVTGLLATSG
jgi:8-oxo-dGTP pyrophosphatase MutT (NUDIX family)